MMKVTEVVKRPVVYIPVTKASGRCVKYEHGAFMNQYVAEKRYRFIEQDLSN